MRVAFAVVVAVCALAGCGPSCQSACTKVWSDQPPNCAHPSGFGDWHEDYGRCVDECTLALKSPGDLGSYNPDDPSPNRIPVLENDRQAAAWMDCVDQTACQRINEYYCPGGGL